MNRPRLLVLGGSGQLGQAIARDSMAAAYNIFAPSSTELDIRDGVKVLRIVQEVQPDFVVNCAAFTAVDRAENDRDHAFAINADGPRNVALACVRSDTHLIHISTDFVFDGETDRPYRENDVARPINVYGESKLLGEHYVALAAPNSCVLRVSWLFGSSPSSFVAKILAKARRGDPVRVVNDQVGCPTSAAGLSEVLFRIAGARPRLAGLFHYCGWPQTTWFGFATEIVRQAHECGILPSAVEVTPITSDELGGTTRRPRYSVLDTRKIEADLGIACDSWMARLPRVLNSV